jgi:membrane fusion protein, adhesin transport system
MTKPAPKQSRANIGLPTAISADLTRPPKLALTLFVWLLAGTAAATVAWAARTNVDEVTIGEGRIIPAGRLKVVQNLEGGIVRDILAREGASVQAGETLIIMDPTSFGANLAEQTEKLAGLEAMRIRLKAEIDGVVPQFPESLKTRQPGLIDNEHKIYESRMAELSSALEALDQASRQREQEIAETRAKIDNLDQAKTFLSRELAIVRPMVLKGVAPKIELVRLEQKLNDIAGQLGAATLSLPRIEAALAEARFKRREKEQNFRGEAMTRLSSTEVEFAALAEAAKANADKVQRTRILAPVSGTIKTVAATTIGEVIKPGVNIVEIVPAEESLLVEARVRPQDIAFLRPGLPATIELSAYDPSRYGGLEGTVETIAADSVTTEKGETFYNIRLRTKATVLKKDGISHPIIPGMVAVAKIKVGQKSVLDYIAKPVMRLANGSLQER